MPRKLIPLTKELDGAELNSPDAHVSMPSGERLGSEKHEKKSKKILSMISHWGARRKGESSKKLDAFSTKRVSEDTKVAAMAEEEIGTTSEMKEPNEKTVEIVKISNEINYASGGRNISLESFKPSHENDDDLRPQPPSRSPSDILAIRVPTKNYLKLLRPRTGIALTGEAGDESEEKTSKTCEQINFDPREKQRLLDGQPVKVFKRGEEFFVKISSAEKEGSRKSLQESSRAREEVATCRRAINVRVPQLNLLTPMRRVSTLAMTLGKTFGIQLGSHNILNDLATAALNGNHALDVAIVAHGMSHRKHPANWSERDIDQILGMGVQLHEATKDVQLDRLSACTKGFTYSENFIQVKISEPVVIGKILTLTERSMDLLNGLYKFFCVYRHGILETMKTVLYIVHENGVFYVFDPRGRNEECERDDSREAALIVLTSVDSVFYLIANMSNINKRAPFKISHVKLTKFVNKAYAKEPFTASCGGQPLRNVDFGILNENIAVLVGNLSLNSDVFGPHRNRHGLATSIAAMIYAKIDPAISWSKSTLDNVLHFGSALHREWLHGESGWRSLKLEEIPSKFYLGECYCAKIALTAYVQRAKVTSSRFLFNNPIAKALIESLKAFRCLLLEVDNYTFAVWRSETADIFFLFDGYQKSVSGAIDHFDGAAAVLLFNAVDQLCENVVQRLLALRLFAASSLSIHGMKVVELKRLSKKQMRSRPRFRLVQSKCIRPFTADDAFRFKDTPSTIDSVAPVLTKEQQLQLQEKKRERPRHQLAADLNSPSLLCLKVRTYEELMASVEGKLSILEQPRVADETREIVREIYSEILLKIDEGEGASGEKSKVDVSQSSHSASCGEFVGVAERVLLKTDLGCLERERDEMIERLKYPSDDTIASQDSDITLSREKLVKSHYHELPDKSQIVRGTKSVFALPLEAKIFDYENFSILVGISAILTSTKYSIATWSPEIVDYVLGCAQILARTIELAHRMSFYTVDEHILPRIHINDKFYELRMSAVVSDEFARLESYLGEILADIDRVLVVTTCGSVAVMRRKNFHYLVESATCNMVGFRIRNDDFGAACVMRFDTLHALVRRIHANHSDVHEQQKFLIYRVTIACSDRDRRSFIPFTASQEKIIIDALRHNRMTKREAMIERLRANDAKVREERERLRSYREASGVSGISPTTLDESQIVPVPEEANYELDLSAYENANAEKSPYVADNWREVEQQKTGYSIEEGVIRGTFGYANRTSDADTVRACHFASVYAILYALHHPFEQMNYRSVDIILENGVRVYEAVDRESYGTTKALRHLIVDEMSYELRVLEFTVTPANVDVKAFTEFFSKEERHGVVECDGWSVAVVKTNATLHIFDCYEGEKENPLAAWSLHDSLDSVVAYLRQRLTSDPPTMRLYRVSIVASKKLKSKTGYFLLSPPIASGSKACEFVDDSADERIEWTSEPSSIPWSRLLSHNADGLKRYTVESRWKEYDIEMARKLFSLWGNVHPDRRLLGAHMACCVVALIMSRMYGIDEWDAVLLDSICSHGYRHLVDSEGATKVLEMSDLSGSWRIQDFDFAVELELVIFGKLYETNRQRFNLRRALEYVFKELRVPGVMMICNGRSLAVGSVNNETFFMYDSQAYGPPLFGEKQGATYVLKCCCLKVLLACIVMTLNVQQHNVKFHLYAIKSEMTTAAAEKQEEKKEEN